MRHLRGFRIGSFAVLLALFAAGPVVAQPKPVPAGAAPAVPPAAAAPSVQAASPQAKVVVAPALKASLATKRRTDVQKAASLYKSDANGPLIRVGTDDIRLMDLAKMKAGKVSRNTTTLPVKVATHAEAIAKWQSGALPQMVNARVDRRSWQTPIRNQRPRGTCSAFAATAGLESLVKRRIREAPPANSGASSGVMHVTALSIEDLSENHTFSRALEIENTPCSEGGVQTYDAVEATMEGLCAETAFPYTPSCPPRIPPECRGAPKMKVNSVFSMATPLHPVPGIPNDNAHRADNITLLEAFLGAGIDVVFAVDVAGTDWGSAKTDVVDVTLNASGDPEAPRAAHAMLMVGYDHIGKYFIVKNSWGADWGRDGYFYLSYDYVQTYPWYAFAILD